MDVIQGWCTLNFDKETSGHAQWLWGNSYIRIEGKPVFWRRAFVKGLKYVHQLYSQGNPITYQQAQEHFSLNFVEFNQLLVAIPRQWKSDLKTTSDTETSENFYQQCLKKPKLANYLYRKLNQQDQKPLTMDKWVHDLGVNNSQVEKAFSKIVSITNIPKYRSFQFRLLHKALITNRDLMRWGIVSSDACSFCGEHSEDYLHLFCLCPRLKPLLEAARVMCINLDNLDVAPTPEMIILNHVSKKARSATNFIYLVLKQYIYRTRCLKSEPCVQEFKQIISNFQCVEKYIAIKNGKLNKFYDKWPKEKDYNEYASPSSS